MPQPEAEPIQAAARADLATRFQPKHDQAALLAAYSLHRSTNAGSDGDFCAENGVPVSTMRLFLARWRANAAAGKHPITGYPHKDASSHLQAIGTPTGEPEADEEISLEALETGNGEELQAHSIQALKRSAWKLLGKALKTPKSVTAPQLKLAQEIVKLADKPASRKEDEASEFAKWPGAKLVELIDELRADAMAQRVEPEPIAGAALLKEYEEGRMDEPQAVATVPMPDNVN